MHARRLRGHLKEGAQRSNEGAQELKGGAQASKGGAAPRYVALANSLGLFKIFTVYCVTTYPQYFNHFLRRNDVPDLIIMRSLLYISHTFLLLKEYCLDVV